jgi:hypothetical protein
MTWVERRRLVFVPLEKCRISYAGLKRGEIWWAELPPPVGSRPVVILTRDAVLKIGAI